MRSWFCRRERGWISSSGVGDGVMALGSTAQVTAKTRRLQAKKGLGLGLGFERRATLEEKQREGSGLRCVVVDVGVEDPGGLQGV